MCVFSFSLYTLSKMFLALLLFSPLFTPSHSPPPPSPPPCVPCRTEPQILKILPLVYLACLCLSFSLFLLPYISPDPRLSSPFFFPFYLSSASPLTLRSIRFFRLKPRGQSERSCGIFEVGMLNMLNSKDVLKNLGSSERC